MNHRQKEIMKFIALGCIVAVVFITSRFIPLSKIFSLYTGGTSVSTEANFAELGSNAEVAAEIARRIADMTPEERQEAERAPLPEEDKAQLVNPEGETLLQQYRENRSPGSGEIYFGDVFANPPTRHSFEGEVPNPRVFTRVGPSTDLHLTKKSVELVTNIYTFRTQNYSNTNCAIASFESEDFLPGVTGYFKDLCDRANAPTGGWIKLANKADYIRLDLLIEEIQGEGTFFNDYVGSTLNDRTVRVYQIALGAYDKNNVRIASLGFGTLTLDWHRIDNVWKVSNIQLVEDKHIYYVNPQE